MKHLKYFLLFVTIVLICTSQYFAFDGERKGFTLGLGVGYTPYANPDLKGYDQDFSFNGFGMNLLLGYNWNSKNLIAYDFSMALGLSQKKKEYEGGLAFSGICWYHYLKVAPKSFYSIIGIGRVISLPELRSSTGSYYLIRTTGLGVVLGGGYEFAKHFQFSTQYVFGNSSDYGDEATNNMIYMSVSFLAY